MQYNNTKTVRDVPNEDGGVLVQKRRTAYAIVAANLRRHIAEQHLAPGTKLPALRLLASEHGVSLATMQSAIRLMESSGELATEPSRGVFITAPRSRSAVLVARKTVTNSARIGSDPVLQAISSDAHIGIILKSSPEYQAYNWQKEFSSIISRSLERTVCAVGASTLVQYITGPQPIDQSGVMSRIDALVDAGADALVLVSLHEDGDLDQALAAWDQNRTPLILIGASPSRALLPQVHYDSRQTAQHAARHILLKGCRDLAFFSTWPLDVPWVQLRVDGTKDAMAAAGMDPSELAVWASDKAITARDEHDAERLRAEFALTILKRNRNLDGVVASNDHAAIAVIRAARDLGLSPGRDLLITGFDDIEAAQENGLTTMRRPAEEMGIEGGRLVMQLLGGVRTACKICVNAHLIVRDSTRSGLSRSQPVDVTCAAGNLR